MMNRNKLLSFVSPVTIERRESSHNPYLEVQLTGGKYVLNSGSSNYSYGSLHTLFKKTFRRLKPDWKNIEDVLILGYGSGCVAETILRHNSSCRITGVEIDDAVIQLGQKYFSNEILKNVNIVNCPAEEFIRSNNEQYNLVIIDVYIGTDVPGEVQSEEFLVNVRRSLKTGGIVIFNKYVYSRKTTEDMTGLRKSFMKVFGNVRIIRVMLTGRMLISEIETNPLSP